jgi:hypothetical protein
MLLTRSRPIPLRSSKHRRFTPSQFTRGPNSLFQYSVTIPLIALGSRVFVSASIRGILAFCGLKLSPGIIPITSYSRRATTRPLPVRFDRTRMDARQAPCGSAAESVALLSYNATLASGQYEACYAGWVSTRSAASESPSKAAMSSCRDRSTCSSSSVVQFPRLSQMTFGGAPRRKASCRKSSSFATTMNPPVAAPAKCAHPERIGG